MTRIYKLTDANMRTLNGFQWVLGEPTPRLSGEGELCSANHYHVYTSPLQAGLMNAAGSNFTESTMRLFIGDGEISRLQYDKAGCFTATLLREIAVPDFPLAARKRVAILLAKRVCKDADFQKWSKGWLDGSDRSANAVNAAVNAAAWDAAKYAVDAAWYAANAAKAVDAAWYAAKYAVDAAWYAANAVNAANAAWYAANAAWNAANAARYATNAVAQAVVNATEANIRLPNLHRLCREAIKKETK